MAGVKDRLDVDHPAARAYLREHGRKPPPRVDRPRKVSRKPVEGSDGPPTERSGPVGNELAVPTAGRPKTPKTKEPSLELPDDLDELKALTLEQIYRTFGTDRRLKDLLEARSKIAAIQERELGMQSDRGELVSRELVRTHIIGPIDTCFRRLLTDATKTLARRLFAAAMAREPIEEGERIAAEIIGSHLEIAKQQAAKALDDA